MTTTQYAIGYLRVSTARQVEEGLSLAAQRQKIEAWCLTMDYTLLEVYVDEGISGATISKRPALQQALEAVCQCHGALVVYSLSRLSRSTKETMIIGEQLDKSSADLVSLTERIDTTSPAGRMVFRLLAVMAEFERDQLRERVKAIVDYKRPRGESLGECPYGFMVGTDGKTLIENPSEQAVLTTIKAYREQGLSMRAIVTEAERAGLLSRKGKPFQLTQIANMLKKGAA